MQDFQAKWSFEFVDSALLGRRLRNLEPATVQEIFDHFRRDIDQYDMAVFQTGHAKWLGKGLAEYRFRKNPDLLIRIFFTIRGSKVVVVLSAYDKKRDPSKTRQQAEINLARKILRSLDKTYGSN